MGVAEDDDVIEAFTLADDNDSSTAVVQKQDAPLPQWNEDI